MAKPRNLVKTKKAIPTARAISETIFDTKHVLRIMPLRFCCLAAVVSLGFLGALVVSLGFFEVLVVEIGFSVGLVTLSVVVVLLVSGTVFFTIFFDHRWRCWKPSGIYKFIFANCAHI